MTEADTLELTCGGTGMYRSDVKLCALIFIFTSRWTLFFTTHISCRFSLRGLGFVFFLQASSLRLAISNKRRLL